MARTQRHSSSVRHIVRKRASGKCEHCGKPFKNLYGPKGTPRTDATMHHRHVRRSGGCDTVTNLVQLHASCHKAFHDDEEFASTLGYIMDIDNSTWLPVVMWMDEKPDWYLLDSKGGKQIIDKELVTKLFEHACLVPRRKARCRKRSFANA